MYCNDYAHVVRDLYRRENRNVVVETATHSHLVQFRPMDQIRNIFKSSIMLDLTTKTTTSTPASLFVADL